MRSVAVWRSVRCEVVASFLLTLVTSSAALQPPLPSLMGPCVQPVGGRVDMAPDSGLGWAVRWAVGHGLMTGALNWAVRSAHISLPTTIALLVTRRVSALRACLHGVAQVVGALLAAPVLLGMLPRPPRPPEIASHLTGVQGWGAEFLATLMVTLITLSAYESAHVPLRPSCHSSSRSQTTPTFSPSAALPVIAAHIAAALFSAEFTGVGLNPARSLALASVTGTWACHWVFWVGPALGGLLAAFTHEYTAAKDQDPCPPCQPNDIMRDTSRPSAITSTLASPC